MIQKWGSILIVSVFVLLWGTVTYASDQAIVDLEMAYDYSSNDYYTMALQLADRYPQILKLEQIGLSHDANPIYALVMTDSIEGQYDREDFKIIKKHFLVEAGVHARETVNPAIVLKMVESYAMDYYEDSVIDAFDVKELLSKNVLHFIPMVNPDGHDLSKFGISSVNSLEMKEVLKSISDKNYSGWKANIRGVDINRNFPSFYFSLDTGERLEHAFDVSQSNHPSGSFYHGDPASENETQVLMAYMDQYDFRSYLSYHSKGEVLFYTYEKHPESVQESSKMLAEMISEVTGYQLLIGRYQDYGYSTDYFVAMTLKPAITIETVSSKDALPSEPKAYLQSYEQTYLVPLHTIESLKEVSYGNYKLYDAQGFYVRDFDRIQYARGHASLIDGSVLYYKGDPILKFFDKASREDALVRILSERLDLSEITVDARDVFTDTNSLFATFAKNNSIVSGDPLGRFNPDAPVTVFEYAHMLYNTEVYLGTVVDDAYKAIEIQQVHPIWASEATKYALFYEWITEDDLIRGFIIK